MTVTLVVLVLRGTSWADAAAQTTPAEVAATRQQIEQGDGFAQYNLALLYSDARGVPQDYIEAHKWGNLAASRAFAENQTSYAVGRDLIASLMTRAQLAEAQRPASA